MTKEKTIDADKMLAFYGDKCRFVGKSSIKLMEILEYIVAEDFPDIEAILENNEQIRESDLKESFKQCAVLLKGLEKYIDKEEAHPLKKEVTKKKTVKSLPSVDDITIFSDGAAKGNPGPASIGVVLKDSKTGNTVAEISKKIGSTTNNIAEYTALIKGLEKAIELGANKVKVFADSELMVKQVTLVYKTKNEGLRDLLDEVFALKSKFKEFKITHVRREQNKRADELANLAFE